MENILNIKKYSNMDKGKLALKLQHTIGHYNFIRLLAYVKYILNFRRFYTIGGGKSDICGRTIIYMADGRTPHGGFSDRLRGIFSLFEYCKAEDIEFKINFTNPFDLRNFLLPNHYNWEIRTEDISYCKKDAVFRFVNSYSNMTKQLYAKYLHTNRKCYQMHAYTNFTSCEERYAEYFNELFRFSPLLDGRIRTYLKDIGTDYISVSFRLISLLGDFKDSSFAHELSTDEEKELYIGKCAAFIERLHQENPQYPKILVTSDSGLFMKRIEHIPYVYIIKGEVIHMDYVDNHLEGHLKTMTDYFLISKAQKVFCYSYGKMYGATRFAKTAALIGGKPFEMVRE